MADQLPLWQQGWTERHATLVALVAQEIGREPTALAHALRTADFDDLVEFCETLADPNADACDIRMALSTLTDIIARERA